MDFDIARIIQRIAVLAPGFLLAITVHEFMHGYVAFRFGDPTAKLQGRLTFNPISHLDPLGTLLLILAGIGWAKPVPVDPRNLRNPRRDMLWISLAGPAAKHPTAFGHLLAAFRWTYAFMHIIAGFIADRLHEAIKGMRIVQAFGAEGYARLSYAASREQLNGGLDRLEAFLKS